jgi:hypothetical protein
VTRATENRGREQREKCEEREKIRKNERKGRKKEFIYPVKIN